MSWCGAKGRRSDEMIGGARLPNGLVILTKPVACNVNDVRGPIRSPRREESNFDCPPADGGEPHSVLSYRAIGAAWKEPFVRGTLSAAAPLRVWRPQDVHPPLAWHRFWGVAAAVHQKRCSKSQARHALRTRHAECIAPPGAIVLEPRPTILSPIRLLATFACARGLLFYLPGSLHYYGHD